MTPQLHTIRISTCIAVNLLLDRGRFPSQKQALEYVMIKARQKRLSTGFDHHATFQRAYQAYRQFRRRNKADIVSEHW